MSGWAALLQNLSAVTCGIKGRQIDKVSLPAVTEPGDVLTHAVLAGARLGLIGHLRKI